MIPTLNLIHLWRQNEVWFSATFLTVDGKSIDLVKNFSQVTLEFAKQRAITSWNVEHTAILQHTRGTQLYNLRLFALFLFNSLTPEFTALLHRQLDAEYSMDGPLLFLAMCNHIHWNHLAFVESVKHKIRLSTIQEHKNDMQKYLRFLQDNLCIITSTGDADTTHHDLLPHIFTQLRNTTIPLFQQHLLTWQRKYMENTFKVSPLQLVSMADEECQILKHSNQWVETIDPSIVAMKALFQGNMIGANTLIEQLTAHLSTITKQAHSARYTGWRAEDIDDGQYQGRSNDNPPWVNDIPTDKSQIHTFHGRTWYYCTKCGKDGKWVCSHTDATHRASYRHDFSDDHSRYKRDSRLYQRLQLGTKDGYRCRSRSPVTSRSSSPMHYRSRSVSFKPTPPPSPTAKLSLLDSISAFIQEP